MGRADQEVSGGGVGIAAGLRITDHAADGPAGVSRADRTGIRRGDSNGALALETCSAGPRLKSTAAGAMRYAAGVNPMGATGFDVGREPSGAYRGAVPS